MIKIRAMGTTQDLKWLLKIFERESRFIMDEPSAFLDIKGNGKGIYKRVHTKIFREPEEYKLYKEQKKQGKHKDENTYYGSGRRLSDY